MDIKKINWNFSAVGIRAQWFYFFINSICTKWFWFGLEILRLVYKGIFFKYWMVMLFCLLSSKTCSTAPFRVKKIILWNCPQGYRKKRNFPADFKKVHNSCVKKCPKIFPQNSVFLVKFLSLLLNSGVPAPFWNQRKNNGFFDTPSNHLTKKFSTFIKGLCYFFQRIKRK